MDAYSCEMESLISVENLYEQIAPYIQCTPLQAAHQKDGSKVKGLYFKREDLQITNSFTVRAALGIFLGLSKEQLERGLVLTTPGNLGLGFLYALEQINRKVDITLVIPEDIVETKLQKLGDFKDSGLTIIRKGRSEIERYKVVEEISKKEGRLPLNLNDRKNEVAAKGTLALEIHNQITQQIASQNSTEKALDKRLIFICPVGSGALLAGCSFVLKQLMGDKVMVVGAEPQSANDFYRFFYKLNPSGNLAPTTIADSLRSPEVRKEYQKTLIKYVDEVIEVEEDEILKSMEELYAQQGIFAEPSAATTFAAYKKMSSLDQENFDANVVCLISAGNVDKSKYSFLGS